MTPLDIANARIRELEQQIEDLRFELAEARGDIDQALALDFWRRVLTALYGLQPGPAELLFVLWRARGRYLSSRQLVDSLVVTRVTDEGSSELAGVYVCTLRKALGREFIGTIRAGGFFLPVLALSRLDALWTRHKAGDAELADLQPTTPHYFADKRRKAAA